MVRRDKGQSTLEYAIIITVVIAGLVAMQHFMRRGVEGKLRESTDRIGEQYVAGNTSTKITTHQETELVTKETFGIDANGVADSTTLGISRYEVDTPAITRVRNNVLESDKEATTVKLGDEKLIP